MDQGQLVIIELKMLETLLVIESLVPPLGPLREGWIFKKDTSTGKIFYVDCSTGKSQWERPSAPAIQPAPAPVLPSGWIEMVDPASGRKYYCDTISKRTQWERPVCPGYLPGQQQPSGAVAVIPVPTGLQAKKLYVDGVSLKWNPVAIQGVNYVVEFCETLQSAQFYRGYSGNKTHCNCSGLKPGLSYSFRVCACVGGGNDDDNDDNDDGGGGGGYNIGTLGNWSALLEVELPPLPAPVNVKTTTINADAVGVSWAIPQMSVLNPASVSYHVRKTIGQQNTLDYEGAALRYICKDIQAGFSYKFFVRMLCNGAIGPWSAPATTQARAICLQYAGHFKEGPNYKISKDGRTARAEIDCWCSNVVGNAPIPPDVVVKWTVKVIKTRNSGDGIFIGVAPQSIDVESNSNRRDCGWYFCCYDSSLYAGPPYNYGEYFGERYASSGALGDGNEVSVYVDMSSRAISFYVNGKDFGIAYKNVPTNEPLVPVVIITYKEDTVRLI